MSARWVGTAIGLGSLCLLLLAAIAACEPGRTPDTCEGTHAPVFPRILGAGLATPQLLAITVQDATVERGSLVAYVAEPGDRLEEDWILREGRLWARVVGPRPERIGAVRNVQRIACFVGRRLDRRQLDDPAAYRLASNAPTPPSLRRIWRKSAPFGVNDPHRQTDSPFRHTLYLELARTLEPDEQLSVVLPDGLGALPFVNDSRRNRSESLHVNQHGWRAADPSKRGFLAFWLPGGPDYGFFDIGAALVAAGLEPRFEIIAASGEAVFSGPIELRKSPVGHDAAGRYDFYESLYDGSVEIAYDEEPTSRIQPPEGEFWRSQGFTEEGAPVARVRLDPAKTWVYEMDFSAWQGAPGSYRVHVSGLGTSYPFEIRDDVWDEVFRTAMAGLYHQRSGMALDGRHGYTRPRDGHPDDGVVFEQSDLPLMIGHEGGLVDAGPGLEVAGSAEHLTGARVADAWGGYMDAGDWDRRIQHVLVTHTLLDLWELLPRHVSSQSLGLPPAREVLPHPAYQEVELPDLLDEAVWNLDFWRRLQREDGSVPGGVEVRNQEENAPSWLQPGGLFVYQPDPWASYLYAALAAKGALVLGAHSPALAELYRRSALAAWGWAEAHRSDPRPFEQLAKFFREVKWPEDLAAAEGALAEARAGIASQLRDARAWAGAALFRLTGEARFREAFEHSSALAVSESPVELQGAQILAHWEFVLARQTAHAFHAKSIESLIDTARTRYVHPNVDRYAYANVRHNWAPLGWGTGVVPTPDSLVVLRALHLDPGHADYARVVADGLAFVLGGNQANLSLTVGLGDDPVAWPLHVDSMRSGASAPRGITIYGFRSPSRNYGWLFDDPGWSDLYDRFFYVPTAPRDDSRAIHPEKTTWPAWENAFQHPENIESMEYTVHQCIAPMAAYSSYLSGWSAEHAPRLPPARYPPPPMPEPSATPAP